VLTIVEGRVLGSLLEKERTTPEQYPLTLNALVTACNQSTSREPVMHLAEHEVQAALTSLKAAGLARMVHPTQGRSVTRYRQVFDELNQLNQSTCSVLAVMLLRGPQTLAELRTRTERMYSFASLAVIEECLADAIAGGYVRLLERQLGHKEQRWQQVVAQEAEIVAPRSFSTSAAPADPGLADRVTQLEARIERLEAALADLL
jgi:uncharacterized protein YceH (UPF0502 family)